MTAATRRTTSSKGPPLAEPNPVGPNALPAPASAVQPLLGDAPAATIKNQDLDAQVVAAAVVGPSHGRRPRDAINLEGEDDDKTEKQGLTDLNRMHDELQPNARDAMSRP